jgi:outer membrane protein
MVLKPRKHPSIKTATNKTTVYVLAMLTYSVQAMPVQAEDLITIYRQALIQDPVLEAAKFALEAAHQKIPQARAGFLPTVNWTANQARQAGITKLTPIEPVEDTSTKSEAEVLEQAVTKITEVKKETEPLDRVVRTYGWTLQLTQPILRPVAWITYAQAGAQVRQAQAQYSQAQQDLIVRVAQAYFDVVVADNNVRVALAQDNSVDMQLTLAKRNFEVGTSTVTDVHEAKSRFELSKAQRIGAENELQAKQAELERITGNMPAKLAALQTQVIPPLPSPPELTSWISKAKEQHPMVLVQIEAQEVASKEISKNRAGHLPTLDFTASRSANYSSGSLSSPTDLETRAKTNQYSLQLSVPIYSGGMIDSRVKESAAMLSKTHAELESARRQVATMARQAFNGVMNGHAQIEALTAAVTASKSSVNANKIGYKIGTRINIDVLNAEQQLFAAMRDLSKARVETFMQGLRLKASIGILSEADLAELNQSLEMVDHGIKVQDTAKVQVPEVNKVP